MNYYQPRGTFDNRLNTINQQYGLQSPMYNQMQSINQQPLINQQQVPLQNNQVSFGNSVIPVGGIEEVKAYPIDFTGSITYFNDITNNKIYTKQLGLNGAPEIKIYSLDNSSFSNSQDNCCNEHQFNFLNKKIEELEKRLCDYDKILGGFKFNESNAITTNDYTKANESTTNV